MPRITADTAYEALTQTIADDFPECDSIRPQDMRALTDDELAVILNAEPGVGHDAARPSHWADILNSSVLPTQAERDAALAQNLRAALLFEAREFLASDVNLELAQREQRYQASREQLVAESSAFL